jgi:hypothetical protein
MVGIAVILDPTRKSDILTKSLGRTAPVSRYFRALWKILKKEENGRKSRSVEDYVRDFNAPFAEVETNVLECKSVSLSYSLSNGQGLFDNPGIKYVTAEREFSFGGDLLTADSCRLDRDTVEKTRFLKSVL